PAASTARTLKPSIPRSWIPGAHGVQPVGSSGFDHHDLHSPRRHSKRAPGSEANVAIAGLPVAVSALSAASVRGRTVSSVHAYATGAASAVPKRSVARTRIRWGPSASPAKRVTGSHAVHA